MTPSYELKYKRIVSQRSATYDIGQLITQFIIYINSLAVSGQLEPDLRSREYAWALFVSLLSAEDIIKMIPLSELWHSLEIGRLIYDNHKKGFKTVQVGISFIRRQRRLGLYGWMFSLIYRRSILCHRGVRCRVLLDSGHQSLDTELRPHAATTVARLYMTYARQVVCLSLLYSGPTALTENKTFWRI